MKISTKRTTARWLGAILIALPAAILEPGAASVAGAATVTINATVLTKSNCRFTTTAALAFGAINPGSVVDATATTTIDFRCGGSANPATYLITDNDGVYDIVAGAHRMRHATTPTQFLPYGFSYNPASGTVPRNVVQTLTITGTVLATDFQNALQGAYSDTVTLTINP